VKNFVVCFDRHEIAIKASPYCHWDCIDYGYLYFMDSTMRNFLLITVTSLSVLLSACNDDNNETSTTNPPAPTCKVHCAP
jgi:hypothetical protein